MGAAAHAEALARYKPPAELRGDFPIAPYAIEILFV